jgi:hypothetical protein
MDKCSLKLIARTLSGKLSSKAQRPLINDNWQLVNDNWQLVNDNH